MTLHAFISYVRYRRKAKTRHGIHSPFVYSFIDNCLRVKSDKPLVERIHEYFKDNNIIELGGSPENILHFFHNLNPTSDTVILIKGIYQTKEHTDIWKTISEDTRVKLSMDIYAVGLLFFREEFKVKQHFFLKFPL